MNLSVSVVTVLWCCMLLMQIWPRYTEWCCGQTRLTVNLTRCHAGVCSLAWHVMQSRCHSLSGRCYCTPPARYGSARLITSLPAENIYSPVNIQQHKNKKDMIRYDTLQDAVLTCARKPIWVSSIYHTEPTTKKCKTEKLKSKKRIWSEVTVNNLGNLCNQSWRRKGRLQWERFAGKGRFYAWNERVRGWWNTNNNKFVC